MRYQTRLQLAFCTSVLLTLLLVAALPWLLGSNEVYARVDPEPRSIRLDFSAPPRPEPETEPVRRLIDPGAEAEQAVRDTDLISSADSQAQDASDAEGDPTRPDVDAADDFDELGTPPIPPQPDNPATAPQPPSEAVDETSDTAPDEPATEPEAAQEPTATPPVNEIEPIEPESPSEMQLTRTETEPPVEPEAVEEVEPERPPEPAPDTEPEPERFQVAQAQPSEPMPTQELRSTRGRDGGGALQSGFTSFEANKHELGEYMLTVRDKVEKSWRGALQTRYRGSSRTYALIECSIRPDGTLEYAKILEPGASLPYAILCREAIENAAPFGPFPFDVPEIYRSENLEIRWKFSFM